MRAQSRLAYYRDTLRYDLTKRSQVPRGYTIRCSQCDALVICGVPTHEPGCPHDTHECHGCNTRVPVNQRFCGECQ